MPSLRAEATAAKMRTVGPPKVPGGKAINDAVIDENVTASTGYAPIVAAVNASTISDPSALNGFVRGLLDENARRAQEKATLVGRLMAKAPILLTAERESATCTTAQQLTADEIARTGANASG